MLESHFADTETGSYEMIEVSVFVSMKEVPERKRCRLLYSGILYKTWMQEKY